MKAKTLEGHPSIVLIEDELGQGTLVFDEGEKHSEAKCPQWMEKWIDEPFAIVAVDRERSCYGIYDPSSKCVVYFHSMESTPWMPIEDAMRRVDDMEHLSAINGQGFEVYAVMPKCDGTHNWLKSYMPKRRRKIQKDIRESVYAMCDGHCAYCGKPIAMEEMQVDHVDSHYRHEGDDEIGNYLPSCRDCNGLKSDYTLEEFRNVLIPNCAKHNMFGRTNRASRICKAYKLNMFKKTKIVFYFEKKGVRKP